MHVALRMAPPDSQAPPQKLIEAPTHGRAQTVAESVNGSEASVNEEQPQMTAFWDPLQAAIIDASYSSLPGKGLVDLLGQGHYADFGGRVGSEFVF